MSDELIPLVYTIDGIMYHGDGTPYSEEEMTLIGSALEEARASGRLRVENQGKVGKLWVNGKKIDRPTVESRNDE